MRKFFGKRWHSIPVGLVAVLLGLTLISSGVAGAIGGFSVWTGTADVTVTECFTVSNLGGDDGDFVGADPSVWDVTMKPGESKTLNVRVDNSSPAALPITLTAVEAYTSINATWSPSSGVIAGGSYYDFTLTVTATGDATPGTYTVDLGITRG